jgi:hypothetical protein
MNRASAAAAFSVLALVFGVAEGNNGESVAWASSVSLGDLARDLEPLRCIPIPSNLTLCHDVQYPMMRIPNLLDHGNCMSTREQALQKQRDTELLG